MCSPEAQEANEADSEDARLEAERKLEELKRRRDEMESEEFERMRQKQQEAEVELEELKRKREERRKVLEEEEQRRQQEEAERKAREEVCLLNVNDSFPGQVAVSQARWKLLRFAFLRVKILMRVLSAKLGHFCKFCVLNSI